MGAGIFGMAKWGRAFTNHASGCEQHMGGGRIQLEKR